MKDEITVGKEPLKQPIKYGDVSPEQANQLAKVSEFCLQVCLYYWLNDLSHLVFPDKSYCVLQASKNFLSCMGQQILN